MVQISNIDVFSGDGAQEIIFPEGWSGLELEVIALGCDGYLIMQKKPSACRNTDVDNEQRSYEPVFLAEHSFKRRLRLFNPDPGAVILIRQYVVIAAGGYGNLGTTLGDYVVAFALP